MKIDGILAILTWHELFSKCNWENQHQNCRLWLNSIWWLKNDIRLTCVPVAVTTYGEWGEEAASGLVAWLWPVARGCSKYTQECGSGSASSSCGRTVEQCSRALARDWVGLSSRPKATPLSVARNVERWWIRFILILSFPPPIPSNLHHLFCTNLHVVLSVQFSKRKLSGHQMKAENVVFLIVYESLLCS